MIPGIEELGSKARRRGSLFGLEGGVAELDGVEVTDQCTAGVPDDLIEGRAAVLPELGVALFNFRVAVPEVSFAFVQLLLEHSGALFVRRLRQFHRVQPFLKLDSEGGGLTSDVNELPSGSNHASSGPSAGESPMSRSSIGIPRRGPNDLSKGGLLVRDHRAPSNGGGHK